VKEIAALEETSRLVRLKSEISNQDIEKIDEYMNRLEQKLASLTAPSKGA
jgi:archaellum component FlaC